MVAGCACSSSWLQLLARSSSAYFGFPLRLRPLSHLSLRSNLGLLTSVHLSRAATSEVRAVRLLFEFEFVELEVEVEFAVVIVACVWSQAE